MIHGTYYFGRKRVACRNAFCTTCKAPRFAEGLKSLVVLHVFFLPLLPIAIVTRWFCTECHEELNARRPTRPIILIAGMLAGGLMAFIGLMIILTGGEKLSGILMLFFGLLLGSVIYYALRKGEHKSFDAAVAAVVPLRGDQCPYCKSPLFASGTPHCHVCKVDIITK